MKKRILSNVSIGKFIRDKRTELNYSQDDLARELGITKTAISNWENGNVLPSIEMLTRLADAFAVTSDYLLGRDENAFLDVSKLTEIQRGHVSLLIDDLVQLNEKA